MSIKFNDTTTKRGLVQMFELEIGANPGDYSGDTTKLKQLTADINNALDDYFSIAIPASGTWQLDDSNQTDYPEIKTSLVAGQRDYPFTTDENGNLILDIYRVFVKNTTNGIYSEIYPVDQQSDSDTHGFTDGQNSTGVPYHYDKTANGIFLDPIPGENISQGLKVMINREASYFTYTDTTRKPGVPGLHHAYFYLKPALEYARRNGLTNERKIKERIMELEKSIVDYFSKRDRDSRDLIEPEPIIYT